MKVIFKHKKAYDWVATTKDEVKSSDVTATNPKGELMKRVVITAKDGATHTEIGAQPNLQELYNQEREAAGLAPVNETQAFIVHSQDLMGKHFEIADVTDITSEDAPQLAKSLKVYYGIGEKNEES